MPSDWNPWITLANFHEESGECGQRIFAARSLRARKGGEEPERGSWRRRRNRTAVSHGGSTTHRKLMWIPRNWSPRYSPAGTVFLYLSNSIDNISSFLALFFSSFVRPTIRSPSWETRPPEIIGFRGLNYFLLDYAVKTSRELGKARSYGENENWLGLVTVPAASASARSRASCRCQSPRINPFGIHTHVLSAKVNDALELGTNKIFFIMTT